MDISIYVGVPGGYEAGLGEIFGHSVLAGILWTTAIISGPLIGVAVARRQRRKGAQRHDEPVGTR